MSELASLLREPLTRANRLLHRKRLFGLGSSAARPKRRTPCGQVRHPLHEAVDGPTGY